MPNNPLAVPRIEKKWPIAFDMYLNRPGGPLVQSKLKAPVWVAHKFAPHLWLKEPSQHMQVYQLTEKEIEMFVKSAEIAYSLRMEGRYNRLPSPR
jgi:hypothetical protein